MNVQIDCNYDGDQWRHCSDDYRLSMAREWKLVPCCSGK